MIVIDIKHVTDVYHHKIHTVVGQQHSIGRISLVFLVYIIVLFLSCTIRTNNIRRFTWLQIHDNCPNILDITPGFLSKSKSTHVKEFLFFLKFFH